MSQAMEAQFPLPSKLSAIEPILNLIDAFAAPSDLALPSQFLSTFDPTLEVSTSLGDFDRLYNFIDLALYKETE